MFTEEHLYSIALRQCALVGDIIFNKLVKKFGTAKLVWESSNKDLNKTTGIGKKIALEIGKAEYLKFAEKEISFCERNKITINLRHLGGLPTLLAECDDAPAILYQKGKYNNFLENLSIVGTRNITEYGKTFISNFISETSHLKYQTISGLALGVDEEVHHKSIENAIPTVAVLAHGLHTIYPAKNKKLAEKILENNGTLLSEFNSNEKPDREHFIQRNRIIAGISPTTIVVETAFGGGSISTATFANNYNREVFALPGKITDKYSQGCNHLIFQNKASAISTIKDLKNLLNFNGQKNTMEELFPKSTIQIQLSDDQSSLLEIINANPKINLDELVEKTSLSTHKILPIILELELLGRIKSLSGRQFIAI